MIAIYMLIGLICLTIVLKIGLDIDETLRIRRIRQTVMNLASQHYQPSLLVIVQHSSVKATLALLDQLADYAALQPNTKVVVLLDSKYDKPKAVILRRSIRQNYSSIATVSCIKNPNLLSYAKRRRSDFDLVTALPDTARLTPNMYQAIVLPLGDPRLEAVSAPGAVVPQASLVSAWRSLVDMLSSRLVVDNTTPREILETGGTVRTSCLSKHQLSRLVATESLYAMQASDSVGTSWRSLTVKRNWPLIIPGATLVAVWLSSLGAVYTSLVVTLATVAICYITWCLSSARQLSLYQRASLTLVSPFVYVGLLAVLPISLVVTQLKLVDR